MDDTEAIIAAVHESHGHDECSAADCSLGRLVAHARGLRERVGQLEQYDTIPGLQPGETTMGYASRLLRVILNLQRRVRELER